MKSPYTFVVADGKVDPLGGPVRHLTSALGKMPRPLNLDRSTVVSGIHVSSYTTVVDVGASLDFYRDAFAAVENGPRLTAPDGGIVHTEIRIGMATIMMAEHNPDFGTAEPHSPGGTPIRLALEVQDVDADAGIV